MEFFGRADNERMSSHLQVLLKQISCEECGRRWLDPSERWRVYVTDDDPAVPIPYCPHCAAREFDDD